MSKAVTETITLDTPITREKGEIAEIQLRKPTAGELRGLNLADLLQMDVNSLTKVLPRISNPTVHEAEVRAMDPADLVQLGGAVAGFLLSKAQKGESFPSA
ncbi:MAG: phage tail assembly protein [Ectothiorhodospiraceae bacterium]|nr:phage tail assembly protein [Ectothiorhodospiraceae bacterium]